MTDTRDLRDPQKLGEKLIADIYAVRETFDPQATATKVYDLQTGTYQHANYDDGGVMSSNPAEHHANPMRHPEMWANREEVVD